MKGKILIVEDYIDWRELLSGMLRREGHQVETAATLAAAQTFVDKTKDLDLAILDIRLVETDESNEDGMRLLAYIRAKQPFTRVMMITGHGTMEMQRRAFREYRAFDFFRKEQFESQEFRKGCREAIEQAARERGQTKDKDYMRGQRYEMWERKNKRQ